MKQHAAVSLFLASILTSACADVQHGSVDEAYMCIIPRDRDPAPSLGRASTFAGEDFNSMFNRTWEPIPSGTPLYLVASWGIGHDNIMHARARCHVERVGNELRITASASWEVEFEDALDGWYSLYTECEIPPLEDGQYELVMDGERKALTIPSGQSGCF